MLSASSEGRRGHRSGAPPAACLRWQEWAGEQLLVRGLGERKVDTWEEGCVAMTFQPGAGQRISWAADSRVQQTLPMRVLGWDWARERENSGQAPRICWKTCKTWNLMWVFWCEPGSQSSIAWLQKRKEKHEGFQCWWFVWVFKNYLFIFPIGKYYLYTECLQNILCAVSKSSFGYLAISLYHFQMNPTRLKGQPWLCLILCQYHWWLSLSRPSGLACLFTKTTLLKTQLFRYFFLDEDLIVKAWFYPLKNSICINSEQEGDSLLRHVLPSRAWSNHSHVPEFWYPWTPGESLAGCDAAWCAGGRTWPLQQNSLLLHYYCEVSKLHLLNVLLEREWSLKAVSW